MSTANTPFLKRHPNTLYPHRTTLLPRHISIGSMVSRVVRIHKPTLDALLDAARTTLAAVLSLLLARLLKLPEAYWAPISAIVIIQSTLNPRTVAWQRFAGTALGAVLGALVATFFRASWLVYGVAIFLCGALCALLRLRGAYRFTAITLSIILLVAHSSPAWIVASHRFVEVSLGIAVALAIAQVWPDRT